MLKSHQAFLHTAWHTFSGIFFFFFGYCIVVMWMYYISLTNDWTSQMHTLPCVCMIKSIWGTRKHTLLPSFVQALDMISDSFNFSFSLSLSFEWHFLFQCTQIIWLILMCCCCWWFVLFFSLLEVCYTYSCWLA